MGGRQERGRAAVVGSRRRKGGQRRAQPQLLRTSRGRRGRTGCGCAPFRSRSALHTTRTHETRALSVLLRKLTGGGLGTLDPTSRGNSARQGFPERKEGEKHISARLPCAPRLVFLLGEFLVVGVDVARLLVLLHRLVPERAPGDRRQAESADGVSTCAPSDASAGGRREGSGSALTGACLHSRFALDERAGGGLGGGLARELLLLQLEPLRDAKSRGSAAGRHKQACTTRQKGVEWRKQQCAAWWVIAPPPPPYGQPSPRLRSRARSAARESGYRFG